MVKPTARTLPKLFARMSANHFNFARSLCFYTQCLYEAFWTQGQKHLPLVKRYKKVAVFLLLCLMHALESNATLTPLPMQALGTVQGPGMPMACLLILSMPGT